MKLNRIQIDDYGVCKNLQLGLFDKGLNIVFGTTGTGKTTLRRFVRGVLFGFDQRTLPNELPRQSGSCLEVDWLGCRQQLQRDTASQALLRSSAVNTGVTSPHAVFDPQNIGITERLYDLAFNLSFHDTKEMLANLVPVLKSNLGLPVGSLNVRDDATLLAWQRDQADLQAERVELRRKLENLASEEANIVGQINRIEREHAEAIAAAERELARIEAELHELESHSVEELIRQLEDEAAHLRRLISSEENRVEYVAPVTQPVNDFSSLYQRLDEVDNQIRRWRRVQTDIQNQRVQLREEMLAWNEITLDNDEHPYHNARTILTSLESVVDRTEQQLAQAQSSAANESNLDTLTRNVGNLCKQMRDDIYGLCQELGHQYKHIRHKAAVAELKQLRRCYKEIGDNTELLIKRRKSLLNEIQQIDPAGAEAIRRAEHQFCQCAQHEGYLEARRRFVPEALLPTTQTVVPTVVRKDLSAEYGRLSDIEAEIELNRERIRGRQTRRDELHTLRREWMAKRDQPLAIQELNRLHGRQSELAAEVRRLRSRMAEVDGLLQSVAPVDSKPHPFLARVSRHLQDISNDQIQSAWLNSDGSEWTVLKSDNRVYPVHQLSRGQLDQVLLALVVATAEHLKSERVELPLILDDVFANVDEVSARRILDYLMRVANQGMQIIVLAKHNELARNDANRAVVFELPQTTVQPAPYYSPEPVREREVYLPRPARRMPPESFVTSDRDLRSTIDDSTVRYPFSGVSTASVSAYDVPEPVVEFDEQSQLNALKFIDSINLRRLSDNGIQYVGELLELDPDDLPAQLVRVGFSRDQVDRWQSQAWLMVCIPGLNSVEAKLLYSSGIAEPEQLDTTDSSRLEQRLLRFLSSSEGVRFATHGYRFDQNRIRQWYRSLDRTRDRWRSGSGYSRRRKYRSGERDRHSNARIGLYADRDNRERDFDNNASSGESRQHELRARNSRAFEQRSATDRNGQDDRSKSESRRHESVNSALKFYLNTGDDLEAAPSIGPKTAERFAKIGVITVDDFLKQTAESMANKLNYKRITAELIRQWQHQARLVCRIPNLRGHDAQLLVACDVTEPEDLSVMNAAELFGKVGPFSESKEGQRIIRSGKKPDLDEVQDWIEWARNTRSLQAA